MTITACAPVLPETTLFRKGTKSKYLYTLFILYLKKTGIVTKVVKLHKRGDIYRTILEYYIYYVHY